MRPPQRRHTAVLAVLMVCALPTGAWASSGDVPASTQPAPRLVPPLPVWPSDNETIVELKPTFRLNGRAGATGYRVELATDAAFTQPRSFTRFEVAEAGGIAPAVTVAFEGPPLDTGTYYWRAFAQDATGAESPPANYRVFRVAVSDRIHWSGRVEHPRLILPADEVPAFRERLQHSPHLQRGWNYLYNAAASLSTATPPTEEYARGGQGQHGNYSSAAEWYSRHLGNVALAAYVANDVRLGRKGVEFLLAACRYERWLGPGFTDPSKFDPPWHAALETAMMTHAVATAYDLLYGFLSPDERRTVRAALLEKGLRPLVAEWADPIGASRLPRHQLPTGNWVMVCSASAGVGALALLGEEEPEATQMVRLVRNRVRAWLLDRGGDWYVDQYWPANRPNPIPAIGPSEPNFGRDGGYKESLGYMNYAMRYVCSFADGLRRVTGENLFEQMPENLLDPVAWSVLAWRDGDGQVRSRMIDFGDSTTRPNFFDLFTCLMANRGDRRAAWLYHRTCAFPPSPRSLVWYSDAVIEAPPARGEPYAVFRDIGQVVHRRGWSPESPVTAIKFHQNRGHLDLGQFYVFAGEPLIVDSGSTSYGSEIYRTYSSQSHAHNVVLVDGRPQVRTDAVHVATIGTSELAATTGELAAAYPDALEHWTRDLVTLPSGDVIVCDTLAGRGMHNYELLLHPARPPLNAEAPSTAPSTAPASSQHIVLLDAVSEPTVHVIGDGPLNRDVLPGYLHSTPAPYLRFGTAAPRRDASFVTWIQLGRQRSAWTGIAPIAPFMVQAGRVSWDQDGTTAQLRLRIGGADDAIKTDGRVLALWRAGRKRATRHLLLLGGTSAIVDGATLVYADRPVNAAVEFDQPLRARIWCDAPTRVELATRIGSGRTATIGTPHVLVNGERVEATVTGHSVTLALAAGEHDVLLSDLPRPMQRPSPLVFPDLLAIPAVDAPAFTRGVLVRSSSTGQDGMLAVDGDINTGWSSLPGLPLPQWMMADLPQEVDINHVTLRTGQAASGFVETYDGQGRRWVRQGRFDLKDGQDVATLTFAPTRTRRIRVTVESASAGRLATVYELTWSLTPVTTQTQPF